MLPTLHVDNLRTYFHTQDGVVRAVEGVSFQIPVGHTLGIVGESGSGKSVTSLSIMRLLGNSARIESGSIALLGHDLVQLPEPQMRALRGRDVSMIFQEPMTSLNPVYTVGSQVAEAIIAHQRVSHTEARRRTVELFREVGIPQPDDRIDAYPHQMSGGQKQRVMIAMALACNPQLLIADEPTTALDVTIQSQILALLRKLRDERGMSILFITHDLGVIAEIADDVLVMYRGEIVEQGPVLEIFAHPRHPYTKGLLACRPRLDTKYRRLPTVDDFMEVRTVDGQLEIRRETAHRRPLSRTHRRGPRRGAPPQVGTGRDGPPLGSHAPGCRHAGRRRGRTPAAGSGRPGGPFPRQARVLRPLATAGPGRRRGELPHLSRANPRLGRRSGCGKTTTGRAILRLIEPTAGKILLDGIDVRTLSPRALRRFRSRMQIMFQDPYGSLNPRMTVESAVTEPMVIQGLFGNRRERRDRAAALLEEVGISASPSAPLPARILRRSAATHLHRPGAGSRAGAR